MQYAVHSSPTHLFARVQYLPISSSNYKLAKCVCEEQRKKKRAEKRN